MAVTLSLLHVHPFLKLLKIPAQIVNTIVHVTRRACLVTKNKRKKWVSECVWTVKCHSVLTPASLQVYILLELQWKKSPSYEDPSDPCEIPVLAPPPRMCSHWPQPFGLSLQLPRHSDICFQLIWRREQVRINRVFNDKILQKLHVCVRFYFWNYKLIRKMYIWDF